MTDNTPKSAESREPAQMYSGPDVIDLFPLAMSRHWHRMLAVALVAGVLSLVVSLFLPPLYRARASIFVNAASTSSRALAMLAPQASGLAGMLQTGSRASYLVKLIESERMRSRIIDNLDLHRDRALTHGKKMNREELLESLADATDIVNDRDGMVTVQVTTRSAKLSADIANEYVRNLGKMVMGVERKKRIFIGEQMLEEETKLHAAEEALKDFEDSTQLVALDEQTRTLVAKLADLKAEKLAIEMAANERSALLDAAGSLPQLVELEEQAQALKAKNESIDAALEEYESRLRTLPEQALRLARLTRDARIHEKAYQLLVEQYKIAQISEKEEDAAFEVMDKARVPEKKFRPRRLMNAAGGFVTALILSLALALAIEKRRARDR